MGCSSLTYQYLWATYIISNFHDTLRKNKHWGLKIIHFYQTFCRVSHHTNFNTPKYSKIGENILAVHAHLAVALSRGRPHRLPKVILKRLHLAIPTTLKLYQCCGDPKSISRLIRHIGTTMNLIVVSMWIKFASYCCHVGMLGVDSGSHCRCFLL